MECEGDYKQLQDLKIKLEADLARHKLELDQSQRQFEVIFQGAGDGIFFCDLRGQLLVANTVAADFLGYDQEEMKSLNVLDFVDGLTRQEMSDIITLLKKKGTATREDRFRHKEGHLVWVEVSLASIELNNQMGIVVVSRDLTEKKKLEQSLLNAQKRDAIGRLAGGMAHEYNNRLASILLAGKLALNYLPKDHPAREYVEVIESSAQNSAHLTQQLLAFGRQQVIDLQTIRLNEALKKSEKLLRPLLREDILFRLDLGDQLDAISFDPTLLEQVILNLILNSRDALPNGGNIVLRTGQSELTAKSLGTFPLQDGSYVWLEIEDDGLGMDPATADQAFEPFFTTKVVGKGTGLGLPMVHGTVKQVGGHVELNSQLDQGTRIRLYFPAQALHQHKTGDSSDSKPTVAATKGHILLVEDEEDLRSLCQTILEHQGFEVLVAHDALETESLGKDPKQTIDLMLTDVVMPGKSGPELYRSISQYRPEMKVLFMSGYDQDILSKEGLNRKDCFLSKPFNSDQLIQAVNRALEDQGTRGQEKTI